MSGQSMNSFMGPLSLAGGVAATALGQPELGIPLMAGGIGSTVGNLAGGARGSQLGGMLGGAAGLGANALAPGLGGSLANTMGGGLSNALGSMGLSTPAGMVGGSLTPNQLSTAMQNPALAGMGGALSNATIAGAMPGAPGGNTLGQMWQGLAPMAALASARQAGNAATQPPPPQPSARPPMPIAGLPLPPSVMLPQAAPQTGM